LYNFLALLLPIFRKFFFYLLRASQSTLNFLFLFLFFFFCKKFPCFFPVSGVWHNPLFFSLWFNPKTQNHSMPTQTRSHSREDSLPSVPDSDFSGTISRNRRSFAALAQKTYALATLSGSTLRSSTSYGSLSKPHKLSETPVTPPFDGDTYVQLTGTSRPSSPALVDNPPNSLLKRRLTIQRLPTLPNESRSSPPAPKMHQTSSRLLRMTEDERPFTKVGFNGNGQGNIGTIGLICAGFHGLVLHIDGQLEVGFAPRPFHKI
jgi:hypothetical protein